MKDTYPLHSFSISLRFPGACEGLRIMLIRACNGELGNVAPYGGWLAPSYNCYMLTNVDRWGSDSVRMERS